MKHSQKTIILTELLAGRSVTQLEVTYQFKILRLGAIIHKLKKRGYTIVTDMIETGTGSKYARYTLLK
jgi:hypothetical protein